MTAKAKETAKASSKKKTQGQRIDQLGDEIKLLVQGYGLMVDNTGVINPIVMELLSKSITDTHKIGILEIKVKYLESMRKSHGRTLTMLLFLLSITGTIQIDISGVAPDEVVYALYGTILLVFGSQVLFWAIKKVKKIYRKISAWRTKKTECDDGSQQEPAETIVAPEVKAVLNQGEAVLAGKDKERKA